MDGALDEGDKQGLSVSLSQAVRSEESQETILGRRRQKHRRYKAIPFSSVLTNPACLSKHLEVNQRTYFVVRGIQYAFGHS
jgi:hypothetical protein